MGAHLHNPGGALAGEVATPKEARAMLSLKGGDQVGVLSDPGCFFPVEAAPAAAVNLFVRLIVN